MNVWLIASAALLLCLVPCAIGVVRGTVADRIIALQAATLVSILTLLAIEEGLQRQSFFDLSLAMAVLAIPSSLLFARWYRRWL
jgi:multisubunit Na+/H+ antiporter MnhF subunit